MKKSKVLQIFEKLSYKEKVKLGKFLDYRVSPGKPGFKKLYHLLLEPQNNKKIDAHLEKAFPGKKLTPSHNRKIINEFLSYILEFLQYSELDSDPQLQSLLLLRSLNKRQARKEFDFYLNRARSKVSSERRGPVEHLYLIQLEEERQKYLFNNPVLPQRPEFQPMIDHLQHYSVLSLLSLECKRLEFEQMNPGLRHSFPILETIDLEKLLQHQDFSKNKVVSGYAHLRALLLTQEDRGHFDIFKKFLDLWARDYGVEDKRDIHDLYAHLLNYCSRSMRKTSLESEKESWMEEIGHIYEMLLNAGIIYENGRISPENLRNLVNIYIWEGDPDRARTLVNDHQDRLLHELSGAVILINLGYICFHEGNMVEAKKKLYRADAARLEKYDLPYYLELSSLHLRVLYELQEFENVEKLAQRVAKTLKGNSNVPADKLPLYEKFCKNMMHLARINQMVRYSDSRKRKLARFSKSLGVRRNETVLFQWFKKKVEALGGPPP